MDDMHDSELQFRIITETAHDAIITLDADGHIVFWNKAAERIFGYSFAEISGRNVSVIIPHSLRNEHRAGFNHRMVTGRGQTVGPRMEMLGLHKDGHEFPIELTVSPWQSPHGTFVTGIIRDITARKNMQEALKRSFDEMEIRVEQRTQELALANQALQAEIRRHHKAETARKAAEKKLKKQQALSMRSDRLRSLGEMAAGIAHELYQPLVGVRGLAEHILIGMERGWELNGTTLQERLSLIIKQADRMSHIIEHVRLFARDACKPEEYLIRPDEVVVSAMDLMQAQLQVHGCTLEADLRAGVVHIRANPFSLEEVLLNLLANARDAIEEKKAAQNELAKAGIRVTTQREQCNGRPCVSIKISDSGIGIPPKILAKVFDPFYTTKRNDRATGLGLAICKSLVEQFHGTIEIFSTWMSGTTVTLMFPQSMSEEAHET